MWVAQTYLGTVEPDAKLFAYYLYTGSRGERAFSERLQVELEKAGSSYGEQVSILVPNPRYADRIESEVRQHIDLWLALEENLPGLLISPRPLSKWKPEHKDNIYVPFDVDAPDAAAEVINRLRGIADETIRSSAAPVVVKKRTFRGTIWEAIELKPGVFGFRVDLKKLLGL